MTNKIIREEFSYLYEDFKTGTITEYYKNVYETVTISIKKPYWEVAKIKSTNQKLTLRKYIEELIKND